MKEVHPWPIEPLSSLADSIDYGLTASAIPDGEGPKFLRITDIQDGIVDWNTVPTCACSESDMRANALRVGDIVFARTGATTGKSFLIRNCPSDAVFASYLIRVRPGTRIDPGYLSAYFQTPFYWRQVMRATTGTAQAGVNASKLKDLQIPLPPLPEQKRIAAILDKADAVRRKRRESICLADDFLRSVFLDMFGDPVTNPKRWAIKPMGELVDMIGGGTPSRAVSEYFTGSTCWATSKDMKGETLVDTEEHITGEAIKNSATKLVPAGSILIVVKSKILLHTLPVMISTVPVCFGQDLKAILPQSDVPARYLARHLRVGQQALLSVARGVNTEGLTLDHLRAYRVMVPPGDRMKTYAAFEAKVTKQRSALIEDMKEAESLFGAVSHRAFAGEL